MAENIDIKDKLVTNEDLKAAMQFAGGGFPMDVVTIELHDPASSPTGYEVVYRLNGNIVDIEDGFKYAANPSTFKIAIDYRAFELDGAYDQENPNGSMQYGYPPIYQTTMITRVDDDAMDDLHIVCTFSTCQYTNGRYRINCCMIAQQFPGEAPVTDTFTVT